MENAKELIAEFMKTGTKSVNPNRKQRMQIKSKDKIEQHEQAQRRSQRVRRPPGNMTSINTICAMVSIAEDIKLKFHMK